MKAIRTSRDRKTVYIDNIDFINDPHGFGWLERQCLHFRTKRILKDYIPDVHGNYPKRGENSIVIMAKDKQTAEDLHKYYRIRRQDINIAEQMQV